MRYFVPRISLTRTKYRSSIVNVYKAKQTLSYTRRWLVVDRRKIIALTCTGLQNTCVHGQFPTRCQTQTLYRKSNRNDLYYC